MGSRLVESHGTCDVCTSTAVPRSCSESRGLCPNPAPHVSHMCPRTQGESSGRERPSAAGRRVPSGPGPAQVAAMELAFQGDPPDRDLPRDRAAESPESHREPHPVERVPVGRSRGTHGGHTLSGDRRPCYLFLEPEASTIARTERRERRAREGTVASLAGGCRSVAGADATAGR